MANDLPHDKPSHLRKPQRLKLKDMKMSATSRLHMIAEQMDIDPFEVMLHFASRNWVALGLNEHDLSPGHQLAAAMEAAKYMYPTLKAIEAPADDGTAPDERKLAIVSQAMDLIRQVIKKQGQDIEPNPITLDGQMAMADKSQTDPTVLIDVPPQIEDQRTIEVHVPKKPKKMVKKTVMVQGKLVSYDVPEDEVDD